MKKSSLLPGSMDSAPPRNEEISPGLSASIYIVRDNRKMSQRLPLTRHLERWYHTKSALPLKIATATMSREIFQIYDYDGVFKDKFEI